MERNRLTITTESRIHGDVYVRFGGEYVETCRSSERQGATCLASGNVIGKSPQGKTKSNQNKGNQKIHPILFQYGLVI